MADLSVAQRAALAQLIERCSDRNLPKLRGLAGAMAGDRSEALRDLVDLELLDRRRRDAAFAPLSAVFRPRADGLDNLAFPAALPDRLWRAATRHEPELLPQLDRDDDLSRMVADRLCHSAAVMLRDAPDQVWPDAQAGQAEALASFLDLASVARRALPYLEDWAGRPGPNELAELKLALRQAAAAGPTGVGRLLDILFAHLDDARLMLRVVALIATGGRDTAPGQGEADLLIDRLLTTLARRAAETATTEPIASEADLLARTTGLDWCAGVLAEIDAVLPLQADSAWARAVRQARVRIALSLSDTFSAAEKAVEAVLPEERATLAGRMTRPTPRLDQAIDPAAADHARRLVTIVGRVRDSAAVFGCEAERRQMVESITGRLATWADEAIERLNDGALADEATARKRVALTGELLGLIGASEASRTVRRRLAISGNPAGASSRASPPAA